MYKEIMFANRNNHLLKQILRKKRKGGRSGLEGEEDRNPIVGEEEEQVAPVMTPIPVYESESVEEENSSYPDTKYLYKNISSNANSAKTNVCAFYLEDKNFVKFIVELQEGGKAVFPSLVMGQSGGFLDEGSSSNDLDKKFEEDWRPGNTSRPDTS
jgi:hypothetical protein